jgi:hypothetical protein
MPSENSSCDPGWMLPLSVFSLVYSVFITTGANTDRCACGLKLMRRRHAKQQICFFACAAGDDWLYQAQRPLLLTEVYTSPSLGVLPLLKMALWHALWVEVAPSPGVRRASLPCLSVWTASCSSLLQGNTVLQVVGPQRQQACAPS